MDDSGHQAVKQKANNSKTLLKVFSKFTDAPQKNRQRKSTNSPIGHRVVHSFFCLKISICLILNLQNLGDISCEVDKYADEGKMTPPRKSISALRSQTNFGVMAQQSQDLNSINKYFRKLQDAGDQSRKRKLSIRVQRRGRSKLY